MLFRSHLDAPELAADLTEVAARALAASGPGAFPGLPEPSPLDPGHGRFMPDEPVTMAVVHRVLVLALGMRSTAQQLNALHTHDGTTFDTGPNFGTTMLGMRLGLRFNSDANETVQPQPFSLVGDGAGSIFKIFTTAAAMVGARARVAPRVYELSLNQYRTFIDEPLYWHTFVRTAAMALVATLCTLGASKRRCG